MTWQKMLFSGEGRIRRRDYWLWSIGVIIAYMAIYIGIAVLTGTLDKMGGDDEPIQLQLVEWALMVPMTWIGVCLGAKRWHDRDKSGWMYLILLIPLVGLVWNFIECGCLDGTQGRNKYGPSPKGIGEESSVF